jgi:phage FluMu gp28-like protein
MIAALLFFMAAVLPSNIDSETKESRYFLPYQLRWIRDDSQLRLWEKSFRIGATWADAFKNVRKRLHFAKRDYLFASKDYPSALEYMQICRQFCDVYDLTRSIVDQGETEDRFNGTDADGKKFTETVKIAFIKFDNGSHIRAFSSSPNAMLVYGGDVGLDEFPRHERAKELYDVAQARITWGFDLAMWGSHKGNDTLFYEKAQLARKGAGGWSHHFTTIEDAVREGLVEKINQTRGTNFTREGFIADCKNRAADDAVYQEAYMCNPQNSASRIVEWSKIELCLADYDIERVHLEKAQIEELFGLPDADLARMQAREGRIGQFLAGAFPQLLNARRTHRLGGRECR